MQELKRLGRFAITASRKVSGEITLSGPNSLLYLWDTEFLDPEDLSSEITGVLNDNRKVSMLNCLKPQLPGLVLSRDSGISSLHIFPHYALLGNSHLSSSAQTIRRAIFVVDDASSLFYDQRAFRYEVIRPSESNLGRITGHYTPKASIVSTSTDFGRISAYHNIDYNPLDIASGIRISNKISVEIDFGGAVDFGEVVSRVSRVISFLELMIGRPQNLVEMKVMAEAGDERESRFDVYWSMYPDFGRPEGNKRPFHSAVLIQAARQPDCFESVLGRWIERDSTWRDARARFSNNFAKELRYDDDRLTGAANMFDILPDESFSQNKGTFARTGVLGRQVQSDPKTTSE